MLWVQVSMLVLGSILTSLSGWAAITARSRLKALQKLLAERSTRSLAELEAAVASLESASSSTSTTLRRLSSRIGMQDVRARRKAESPPVNATPAERKAWLRRGLQTGQLQILSDGLPTTRREGNTDLRPAAADDDADDAGRRH